MSLKVLRASKYLCKMLIFVQRLSRVLASPPGLAGLPSILWGLSNSLLILHSGGWCGTGGRMSEDGCWHQPWPSHAHASSCLYKCTHTHRHKSICTYVHIKNKKGLISTHTFGGLNTWPVCNLYLGASSEATHHDGDNNNNKNNSKTIELMTGWNRRGEGSAEFSSSLHGHSLTPKTVY